MKHAGTKVYRFMIRTWGIHARELYCAFLSSMIMLMIFFIVHVFSGSPYRVFFLLRSTRELLPFGVYVMLDLLFTTAIGFAFGLVFAGRGLCGKRYEEKYHAGMLFVLLAAFWFAVYPLVFRGNMFWMASICLLMTWLLSLRCIILFYYLQPLSGCILLAFLIWISYLLILLLGCMLI